MTTAPDFCLILERTLCSLVDNPREVEVRQFRKPGQTVFEFTCNCNCIGKIVGKAGVRLRALRLVVELAGRAGMEDWRLEQPGELAGERRIGRTPPAEIPEHHNPAEDFELLKDLLMALGINATLSVTGDVNSGFMFTLAAAQVQDDVAIVESHQAVYSSAQQETQPLNLISAIGCIWRAIGAKQGCRYGVQTN